MLNINPEERITPDFALQHPWILNQGGTSPLNYNSQPQQTDTPILYDLRKYYGVAVFKRTIVNILAYYLQ